MQRLASHRFPRAAGAAAPPGGPTRSALSASTRGHPPSSSRRARSRRRLLRRQRRAPQLKTQGPRRSHVRMKTSGRREQQRTCGMGMGGRCMRAMHLRAHGRTHTGGCGRTRGCGRCWEEGLRKGRCGRGKEACRAWALEAGALVCGQGRRQGQDAWSVGGGLDVPRHGMVLTEPELRSAFP